MARHSAKHKKLTVARPRRRPAGRLAVLGVVGVCAVLVAVGVYVARGGLRDHRESAESANAQPVSVAVSTATPDTGVTPVEVPSLVGLKLDEAQLVLRAAGLTAAVRREGSSRSSQPTVTAQDPASGALARTGAVVSIVVPATSSAKKSAAKPKGRSDGGAFVVCIDPGHQAHTDTKTEPIGPGSGVRKPRITGGTTGAFTEVPEYETVLQISTNLKNRLEAAGVRVVMTRTTNDVNLSNAERAQLASAERVDLFVRVHADSSTDANTCGAFTLYPASNAWTKPFADSSSRAARSVQSGLVKRTRAVDRGTVARDDLAGFNWSTVPVVLVAVGYPSNRVEDRLLVSPSYQDKVAQGLSDGVMNYLKASR